MMARWDLSALQSALSKLHTPLALVAAEGDRTVLPRDADRVAAKAPAAFVRKLSGLGHLAHEERPDVVNELILAMARERGVEALH